MVQTPYAGFVFEGLANRNSLGYADIYGLGDLSGMDTMFRGTLRYQGYSDLLYAFRKLGFLDQAKPIAENCHHWVCIKSKSVVALVADHPCDYSQITSIWYYQKRPPSFHKMRGTSAWWINWVCPRITL